MKSRAGEQRADGGHRGVEQRQAGEAELQRRQQRRDTEPDAE